MSLKAKIEAVIYAAEEPVTLAQLVGLLSHEAQAELDRLASHQHSLALDEVPPPSEPDLLNDEIFLVEESGFYEEEQGSAPELQQPSDDAGSQSDGSTPPQHGRDEAHSGNGAAETHSPSAATEEPTFAPAGSESSASNPKQLARDEKERARAIRDFIRAILDELVRDYTTSGRGLEIREVAGGFRLATKPEYHDAVRGFVKSLKPPLKLSLQALETLAVVAYKQPVTAPEISEIRGVDSGGVLGSLMARKLITTAGRKQVIGRPILYKTTKDFLLRFGLKDLNELPSIEEFEKMAGELADIEPIIKPQQEEIPMPAENPHTDPELARGNKEVESITGANLEEERESTEPQADGDSDPVDRVVVDGRLTGISSATTGGFDDNPSAAEAEIQREQKGS